MTDETLTSRPTPLGSFRGTYRGKTALARETASGSWQVKVHDPTNRLSGHDGWLMIGTGFSTLSDARTATGLS